MIHLSWNPSNTLANDPLFNVWFSLMSSARMTRTLHITMDVSRALTIEIYLMMFSNSQGPSFLLFPFIWSLLEQDIACILTGRQFHISYNLGTHSVNSKVFSPVLQHSAPWLGLFWKHPSWFWLSPRYSCRERHSQEKNRAFVH